MKRIFPVLFILIFLLGCDSSGKTAKTGIQHLEQGRQVTALKFFDQALRQNPSNSLALYGKGSILIKQYITADIGLQMIQKSLEDLQEPYKEKALFELARFHLDNKKPEESLKILERSLDNTRISPQMALLVADIHIARKARDRARDIIKTALENFPENADLEFKLGKILVKEFSSYKDGLDMLEKAWIHGIRNEEIPVIMVKTAYLAKDNKKALEYLETMLKQEIPVEPKNELENARKSIADGKWKPIF